MGSKPSDREQEYSEQETAKRADTALRVALSTPPKPHSESKIGKPKREEGNARVRRAKK